MKEQAQIQNDVLLQLSSTPDLFKNSINVALLTISENAVDALGIDRVSIWRFDHTRNEYRCQQCYKHSDKKHSSGETLRIHKYPKFFSALNIERAISVSDVNKDLRTSELKDDYWTVHHITSCLIIPVRISGIVEGITCFESVGEKRTWTTDDVAFASHLTDLVIQIMLNSDVKIKTHQLTTLKTTLSDTVARYSINKLLTNIVEQATQLLGGSYGMVYLHEDDHREARCVVSYNTPKNYTGLVLRSGEGAVGETTRTNQTLIIDDYRTWPNRVLTFEEDKPFTSIISAPLTLKDETVGVIQVMHKDENRRFTEDDKQVMSILATQAAVAVEYSLMTGKTQRQHNFLEVFNRITTTAISALTTTDLVEISLEQILSALAQPIGALKIFDVIAVRGLSLDASKALSEGLHTIDDKFTTAIHVDDWREERGVFSALSVIMHRFGIRASLVVPVVLLGKNIGFLCISSTTPHRWSQEEIDLTSMIGKHLSLATERIQFSRSITTQATLISQLKVASGLLNRLYSFDDALRIIGQSVIELTGSPHAAIYLRNPEGTVNCRWFNKLSSTHINRIESVARRELAHLLVASSHPILISDITAPGVDAQFQDLFASEGFRAVSLYPIVYEEQVTGSIGSFYPEPHNWSQNMQDIMMGFTNQAALTLQNAFLYKQLEAGYTDMALALANAMDRRETLMSNYGKQLADWAERTARVMGCTEQEVSDVRWAALLHDIGKSEVPDEVLQKPGPLTHEEWEIIQKHPLKGEEMIQPLSRFTNVGSIIGSFRERYDGKGYPNKLHKDQIPLGARILAVADAYGSIIDKRPYKPSRPHEEAVVELQKSSGEQFDPIVVNAFLQANKYMERQM
jgi:HD-GYP domain-containing protein (c-di-GMP phosphodiesterase class II)/putative methionine-R-sulfoxide reductase with GAF domain